MGTLGSSKTLVTSVFTVRQSTHKLTLDFLQKQKIKGSQEGEEEKCKLLPAFQQACYTF